MKQIGITTTVPLEVLLAAGYTPADLNNILVSAPDPTRYITIAERAGFKASRIFPAAARVVPKDCASFCRAACICPGSGFS